MMRSFKPESFQDCLVLGLICSECSLTNFWLYRNTYLFCLLERLYVEELSKLRHRKYKNKILMPLCQHEKISGLINTVLCDFV